MDVALSNLSCWLWNGKHQEPRISNGPSSMNSSADSFMRELGILRFTSVKEETMPSSLGRVRRKWHGREEQKIDMEYDFVIVPSDGGCVSDSGSVDSDWPIGWLEPHGTGFSNDDAESNETDNNFAVLVPCYGCNYGAMVVGDPQSNLLSDVGSFSDESKKYVENWISSLRNA